MVCEERWERKDCANAVLVANWEDQKKESGHENSNIMREDVSVPQASKQEDRHRYSYVNASIALKDLLRALRFRNNTT
jgi:hypothetical protein